MKILAMRIAEDLGVSPQFISAIESNKKVPTENFIKLVKARLRLTNAELEQIEEYEKYRRLPDFVKTKADDFIKKVSTTTQRNSYGIPIKQNISENGTLEITADEYEQYFTTRKFGSECFIISVDTELLAPTFAKGTKLVVDNTKTEYIKNGYYVVIYHNETLIVQLELIDEGEIMLLKNPNPAFGTLHILKKNMDQLEIKSRIVYSAFEKEMI